jgi:hypothetical protein
MLPDPIPHPLVELQAMEFTDHRGLHRRSRLAGSGSAQTT